MSNYAIISSNPSWISEKRKDDVKRIISCKFPDWRNGPREYQVASWARTLAGISQVVVVPTGGGKTALLFAVIPLLEALKSERLDGVGVVPERPVVLIVSLILLKAREMQAHGVKAVAVNAETLAETTREGRDLVDEIRRCEWSVSIWSPEQLIGDRTDRLRISAPCGRVSQHAFHWSP